MEDCQDADTYKSINSNISEFKRMKNDTGQFW